MSGKAVPKAHRSISGATHLSPILSHSPEMEIVRIPSVRSLKFLVSVSGSYNKEL